MLSKKLLYNFTRKAQLCNSTRPFPGKTASPHRWDHNHFCKCKVLIQALKGRGSASAVAIHNRRRRFMAE